MSNPNNFILNDDFATLKNDNSASGTVVIPGSVSVPGNGYVEFHTDVSLGKAGAVTRGRIRSDQVGSRWRIGVSADEFQMGMGMNSGSPASYDVYCFIWQPSANVVRFQALIQNPYSTTLTGITATETIDFYVNTFLPPFA